MKLNTSKTYIDLIEECEGCKGSGRANDVVFQCPTCLHYYYEPISESVELHGMLTCGHPVNKLTIIKPNACSYCGGTGRTHKTIKLFDLLDLINTEITQGGGDA